MNAVILRDMTIGKFNIQTKQGRKSTKDRTVVQGDEFVIDHEFIASGMANHGTKCYALKDGVRLLLVRACDVVILP
jgi:hypothetical protein